MSSKFCQLLEMYESYLNEGNLPPLSNIKPTGSTSVPQTSAIDNAINEDPNVVNAKKKAADAIALQLKQQQQQNTITRP